MHLVKPTPCDCVKTLKFGTYPLWLQIKYGRIKHLGIDFAPPHSTSDKDIIITAPADGSVLTTGFNPAGGTYLILSHCTHQNTILTLYLHLRYCIKHRGDTVITGDRITVMGSSGKCTAKHLHFGMAILYLTKLKFIDPAPYFIN